MTVLRLLVSTVGGGIAVVGGIYRCYHRHASALQRDSCVAIVPAVCAVDPVHGVYYYSLACYSLMKTLTTMPTTTIDSNRWNRYHSISAIQTILQPKTGTTRQFLYMCEFGGVTTYRKRKQNAVRDRSHRTKNHNFFRMTKFSTVFGMRVKIKKILNPILHSGPP